MAGSCVVLVEREAGEIALPPVDVVQQAAGVHQTVDHLVFSGRELVRARRHGDLLPLSKALLGSARDLRGRVENKRGQQEGNSSHSGVCSRV